VKDLREKMIQRIGHCRVWRSELSGLKDFFLHIRRVAMNIAIPTIAMCGIFNTAIAQASEPSASMFRQGKLSIGMYQIMTEIADTDRSRAQGLMFRTTLPTNQGMWFDFQHASIQCMWMKNTLIPLSVAFVDEQGVILNIADMQPQREDTHCAKAPARYALEMNQGWFKQRHIEAGAKITF
jgi:uncharacterized membrane protein (UPF0127 family)